MITPYGNYGMQRAHARKRLRLVCRPRWSCLSILTHGVEGAARRRGFGEFYNPCFFNRAIVSRNMR